MGDIDHIYLVIGSVERQRCIRFSDLSHQRRRDAGRNLPYKVIIFQLIMNIKEDNEIFMLKNLPRCPMMSANLTGKAPRG